MPYGNELQWSNFLCAMTLTLVRVSGVVLFAPFFSSTALPLRTKAVFVGAVAYLLAPLVAVLPGAQTSLGFSALLGELAVGLVYGLTLTLLSEMMLFAGQIVGLQFSFSLVNLLDPTSSIQTPLLGDLFQLMGTLVVITSRPGPDSAGLDGAQLPRGAAGQLRAGAQPRRGRLCAPQAASFWRRSSWPHRCWPQPCWSRLRSLCLGKLSPQLPVMMLTVPLKTLTGFAIAHRFAGSVAALHRGALQRTAGPGAAADRHAEHGAR